MDCCLEAAPDVFVLMKKKQKEGDYKPTVSIDVSDEWIAEVLNLRELVSLSKPVIMPSTEMPAPWTGWCKGGFWEERSPLAASFVRTHYKETEREITRAFRDGSMEQHVDAVNSLQSVPWRINDAVLAQVKLHASRLIVAQVKAKVTATVSADLKRKKAKPSKIKTVVRRAVRSAVRAARAKVAEDIATAESLSGGPFYLPFSCDFRGRVSPVPHFHFQREDYVRALFLFDRGMPIKDDNPIGSCVNMLRAGRRS